MRQSYVYILTGEKHDTLYIGVTNDLARRVDEHQNKLAPGFTKRYNITKLIYYEIFEDIYEAICREKQLKSWCRAWKIKLIKKSNPMMEDLYDELNML